MLKRARKSHVGTWWTGIDEMKKLQKCSHCNRPCKGHEGSTGQKCQLDNPMTQEEIGKYHNEWKGKMEKRKRQRRKTPAKEKQPSVNEVDNKNTNAQSVEEILMTELNVVGGGQVSDLLIQLAKHISNTKEQTPEEEGL